MKERRHLEKSLRASQDLTKELQRLSTACKLLDTMPDKPSSRVRVEVPNQTPASNLEFPPLSSERDAPTSVAEKGFAGSLGNPLSRLATGVLQGAVPKQTTDKEQSVAGIITDNRMYLTVRLNGKDVCALFDPGSMISLIDPEEAEAFRDKWKPAQLAVRGVTGGTQKILGVLEVLFDVENIEHAVDFRIVPDTGHPVILGVDFGLKYGFELSLLGCFWRIPRGIWRPFSKMGELSKDPRVFTKCSGIVEIRD